MKAIFFDIDGTLLSHTTKQVPESTKKALHLLKEKGIYTFIATGRHISEIKDLPLDDLEFEGYITLNGQYCYNGEGVIYELPIFKEDISWILKELKEHPFPCMFVEKDQMYINYNNDIVQMIQDSISTPLPETNDLNRGLTHSIYQVIPYDINQEKETYILKGMPHCKHTRWHDLAIDIIPSTGGKQNGILKVLEHYHIDPKDCMAFGDGNNDIDMFDIVGLSIAMGNASQQVKDHADEVTDDIDHDGIYNALVKHQIL